MFALVLMVAMHGYVLSAQASPSTQSTMSWPMQQGESLNDVARLFYPKNPYMQRQFVAATVKLNQEAQPDLNPSAAFSQGSSLVIPDIKVLSKKSQRRPVASVKPTPIRVEKIDAVVEPAISARLQARYDDLVQRNALFKQDLEKLNVKLTQLQQLFSALKVDLIQLLDRAVVPQTAKPAEVQQPVVKTQPTLPVAKPPVAKKADQQVAVAAEKAPLVNQEPAHYIYLFIPILISLLVIGLFFGLPAYTRRQAARLKLDVDTNSAALNKKTFFGEFFSLRPTSPGNTQPISIQSEFSGSISGPDAVQMPEDNEEAELLLEQAKIYVNLGRQDDAIRLLNTHIQAAPLTALPHWFYLLDIYRDTDQKEAFLESAKQLHKTFNVMLPQWEESSISDDTVVPSHSLEDYDHIVKKVTKLWADCEKEADKMVQAKSYLDKLLTDTRDNERTGFTMDAFDEIMLLRNMLDAREKLSHED